MNGGSGGSNQSSAAAAKEIERRIGYSELKGTRIHLPAIHLGFDLTTVVRVRDVVGVLGSEKWRKEESHIERARAFLKGRDRMEEIMKKRNMMDDAAMKVRSS